MGIIAVDLGTTNIKVASFTDTLVQVALESHNVSYIKENGFVEFDAELYFLNIIELIASCYRKSTAVLGNQAVQIVLTGQAESLIVVDKNGKPLRNGISWLDMRSVGECEELARVFTREQCYKITGQPEIIPTWPITKILWLKRNEPECFKRIEKFLLLKDYVIFRLTGKYVGEHSIYPFSHYFDITKKEYWSEPLSYCGVEVSQLPALIEPCSVVGELCREVLVKAALPHGSIVNAGTLDHFAGMIGTGNIAEGIVSESAGTVSSIAAFTASPFSAESCIPLYCGPLPGSYIYLPVCESGGISLEWFKTNFLTGSSFGEINQACAERAMDPRLTFLPYLTGVNPPDFDSNATGVFFGVTINHDSYDMALAIMYGVASLLRKNIDCFKASGIQTDKIISTGGGAKSALWSQIKADICNLPVVIPRNQEAPCLGSAIIGAVSSGAYPDYRSAIQESVKVETIYYPNEHHEPFEEKYQLFLRLYHTLFQANRF
jgi:Sugar (pentulose and hexulose) kinases